MKVEIDFDEILGDEEGTETLQESIRRQVVQSIAASARDGIKEKINAAVSETISSEINAYLKMEMPKLLANIMDTEYKPVDRWGDQNKLTTFRRELVKSITENMTYKKTQYSSDANAFTKAVDEVIAENVKLFKADFQKKVDAEFTAEALRYAVAALKQKLGINA